MTLSTKPENTAIMADFEAFQFLPHGAAVLTADGKRANAGFERLYGGPSADLAGQDLLKLIPAEFTALFRRGLTKATQAGLSGRSEIQMQTAAGGVAWVDVCFSRGVDARGGTVVVAQFVDASASKKREVEMLAIQQQLFHARAIADEQAAERSELESREYQVRSSLDSILRYCEMLGDAQLTTPQRNDVLAAISAQCATIVNRTGNQHREVQNRRTTDRRASCPVETELKLAGRVLVVEDSHDNQRLLGFLLAKLGLQCTFADNGQLAVELCTTDHAARFDLILMDVQMPVMDGHDATRAIRARGWTGPIIALTGMAREGDREKCLEAGCNDYLAKPVDRAAMTRVLASYLAISDESESTDVSLRIDASVQQQSQRFLRDLPGRCEQISTLSRNRELPQARKLAQELSTAAMQLGLAEVASQFTPIESSLALGADHAVVEQALVKLLAGTSRNQAIALAA
jgi:PAS domain S-box-containing protein